ncbi:carboxymuconolactone decarboxylase family protein [Dysgonomonas mossii]|uniref:carboxymuconolactone decarboxylase family protein n=1 Tax=Dysgonomonas mossii TaxID=163665 RepID=UPI0039916358
MENKRLNMYKAAPELYKAMLSLENALQQTSLTPIEKELIKIRASQINGWNRIAISTELPID